ncbi:hypothetical protein H175_16p16 (plasmid) [Bacillus thuringiensis serovar thuringiensis str. IS5056]|nr:hypothetical protein H175_16p16 [Bacillus thuringiensis serovar thuringiensis str. IS5056]
MISIFIVIGTLRKYTLIDSPKLGSIKILMKFVTKKNNIKIQNAIVLNFSNHINYLS